jgi:lipopolysaccharide transport system ATP-binding protein
MPDIVIKSENLGKRYVIGHQAERGGYTALRDVLVQNARNLWNKTKDLASGKPIIPGDTLEEVWALKDVNFEIHRGEAVGIIGRNGAGKSTLLKLLSRITEPSTGRVTITGRVASLLEVGTGFHPELTGRENIYLNGAILGMSRGEITQKFDEIVAFAEVERFLDTPVKRYSSGMYVRLAFAVAAHLEPEILLVDEVLAVGDTQFQKKCIGKIDDISSKEGRTVLFVSHNMGTILSLCNKGILLDGGKNILYADTKDVVHQYLHSDQFEDTGYFIRKNFDHSRHLIKSVELFDARQTTTLIFDYGDTVNLKIKTNQNLKEKFSLEFKIKNSRQELIGYGSSWITNNGDATFQPGETIMIQIPKLKLVQDEYHIDFICRIPYVYHVDNWWDTIHFTVANCRPGGSPISIQNTDQLGSVVLDNVTFSRL